jgi:excinuclease ABC subunit A
MLPEGTRFYVLSPAVRGKKGTHEKLLADCRKNGYVRARINGEIVSLDDNIELDKNKRHDIEIVIDRLVMKDDIRSRLSDSVESAFKASDGLCIIALHEGEFEGHSEMMFSQNFSCAEHGISLGELEPRMFSFNSPFGACPDCDGLGESFVLSPDKLFPDMSKSLSGGACVCNGYKSTKDGSWSAEGINAALSEFGCDVNTPLDRMSKKAREVLFYGRGDEKIRQNILCFNKGK